MAEESKIAVFKDGVLEFPVAGKGREAVLALSLDRLLAKVLRTSSPEPGAAEAAAAEALKAMSPYPDEPLTVSCETMAEDVGGRTVFAAALPEGSVEDIGEALDASKVDIRRVDALSLGALHSLAAGYLTDGARRLVLLNDGTCTAAYVMDGAVPAAARALAPGCDIRREATLLLLEAEDAAGPAPLAQILAERGTCDESLEDLAPVSEIPEGAADAVAGVAARDREAGVLDALPAGWAEVLAESRFKRKMKIALSIAAAVWLAAVGVMAGVPQYRKYKTASFDTMRKEHRTAFRNASEIKRQVEAVRSVSNHDQGALETLRVAASVLPDGVTLSKWNFKRGDRLSFSGVADDGNQQLVYSFKDGLAGVALSQVSGNEDDGDTLFFTEVALPKGVVSRGGKAAFDIECDFKPKEEAD